MVRYQQRHYIDMAGLLAEVINEDLTTGNDKVEVVQEVADKMMALFEKDNPKFKDSLFVNHVNTLTEAESLIKPRIDWRTRVGGNQDGIL